MDRDFRFILPCRFEDVGWLITGGLVPVKEGGKWGFVVLPRKKWFSRPSVEWAIPPRYEDARAFKNGYAPVRINGGWGFIDMSGNEVSPFAYEHVMDVRDGHFRAKVDGKWGIFTLDGHCTLPAEYDRILAEDEYGYGEK